MRTPCRICETEISPFMSFGQQPIANGFLSPEEYRDEYFFDLSVACCPKCAMFQLMEQPRPEQMFHDNYAFFSGTSTRMSEHFGAFATMIRNRFLAGRQNPFVVEIGSNDGIMLKHFAAAKVRHLGIEPSGNVAAVAREQGVNTISEFFNESLAEKIVAEHGPADAFMAANVMCHISDFRSVVAGIERLLKPDGVAVFEDPYLGAVLEKTSYDQIYDEHVFLFSLHSVSYAFAQRGLELIDVEPQDTHGGSMRYFLAKRGAHPVSPRVAEHFAREKELGIDQPETYEQFRTNCERSRDRLRTMLEDLRARGKRVVGYAATSKSTTVLNYCKIGPELIEFISDTTPIKQGKFTPGTHIPVRPRAEFAKEYPDYALLFAWNHQPEIFAKESEFSKSGGRWISFVPEVAITLVQEAHSAVAQLQQLGVPKGSDVVHPIPDLSRPDHGITMAGPWISDLEVQTVLDAVQNGWYYEKSYTYVEKFQKEFAAYHGRKHALMTPNCTTAIHLLLTGLGIKEGDEVLVPECTWIASAAGLSYLRATPVFCDIDPVHWCLDPESVRRNITPRTKAMIVVDLFGNMPLMDELRRIANEHGIHLIEDAAEALGSTYKGKRAGSFGVGSVFSFHRTKTLTTGEGGMLLLDDDKLFDFCSVWRDHGRRPGGPMYFNYEVTYKYMPFNLQAALGWAQFQRVDQLVQKKRWIFDGYRERLAGVPGIQFNAEPEGGFNSVWITSVVFDPSTGMTKARAIEELGKLGVPARPFFYPLSSLPAYPGAEAVYREKNPRAYDISSRAINLSCSSNLTAQQLDIIANGIKTILGHR